MAEHQPTNYQALLKQAAASYDITADQLQPLTDNLEDGVYIENDIAYIESAYNPWQARDVSFI
jgi:hypothetical protein